ncbi:MAG: hypothetical protein JRH20_32160 [Deltaproteobacteria bacterium]|nr:hypothetical protein [Deltaproteobacteria bacterium]
MKRLLFGVHRTTLVLCTSLACSACHLVAGYSSSATDAAIAGDLNSTADAGVDAAGDAAGNAADSAVDGATEDSATEDSATKFSAASLGRKLSEQATQIGYQLVSGGFTRCAYRNDGTDLKCFGNNSQGQLGLGDITGSNLGIGDDPGEMGANLPVVSLPSGTTVQHLAIGVTHVCAILSNKQTVCWGGNETGQLGNGLSGFSEATIGDQPAEMGDNLIPVNLNDPTQERYALALAISGYSHTGSTCALLDNEQIKCWGENSHGQLGQGNTINHLGASAIPYTALPTGRKAVAISGGRKEHFCALLDNEDIVCWGNNQRGQLGVGHVANVGDEPGEMGDSLLPVDLGQKDRVVSLSGAKCALFDDGRIKCWGANVIEDRTADGAPRPCGGVLGVGSIENYGDQPGEMGDAIPFVNFGSDRRAIALAPAAGNIMCAIMEDHTLRCWGKNNWHGGLGTGTGRGAYGDTSGATGDPVTDGFYTPDCRGDAPDEIGDALPQIDLGVGRTALAARTDFDGGCAILDDLTLKCWGTNYQGCLGLELTPQPNIVLKYHENNGKGDDPGEMGDNLPCVNLGY